MTILKKTQIVTKLKNSNFDKTQKVKLEPNLTTKEKKKKKNAKTSFGNNNSTPLLTMKFF